jgi:class 3 adenylate cyclase
MEEHDRLLRNAFADGGYVVDVVGDSFLVAFRRPRDAIHAAAAARQALADGDWPDGEQPAVHMGIHTGEAVRAGSRYFSVALIRTLQICNVARGGQVLLSQATESLLDARDLGELELRDLGERDLPDFERPVRLYELVPAPDRVTAQAARITDA